jgi:succinoglycan biosynthesis protein ExoA
MARLQPVSAGQFFMADFSKILVVIPTLNEARNIEACVLSLTEGMPLQNGPDIVVADGGSTDGTPEIVSRLKERYPCLRLIDNPNRLQSAGINRAVETCAEDRHKILIRCDAHSSYPKGFIASLSETLETRQAASVVIPMDATGHNGFSRAAAWAVDTKLGSGGSAHRGGRASGFVDHGHHAAFDLDWFRRIGGYDPRFSHNEDAEYDKRLTDAGGRIWLDSDIRIKYHMRPSFGALLKQYLNYGRGRARTVRKHRMKPRLRQIIPAVNFAGMLLCLLLAPVLPILLVWPTLYLLALAAVSATAVGKLESPAGLWAGPAIAAMHNAWAVGFLRGILHRAT